MADPITCHILDTTVGKPAADVTCQIFYIAPLIQDPSEEAAYDLEPKTPFAMAKTDNDGRIKNWALNPHFLAAQRSEVGIGQSWTDLKPGIYKVKFLTGKYFHQLQGGPKGLELAKRTFFPFVDIVFQVASTPDNHYHIPLLLSNHSYTTYRGS